MADTIALNDYFKKLQRTINNNADFTLFGTSYIKKNKIDDFLCCILATLPEIYKKNLNTDDAKKLTSMVAYKAMFNAVKGKCFFNGDMYAVNKSKANDCISAIIKALPRDIAFLEKKYQ